MEEVQFKKPTGVYLLAVLFILAPLGNILLSLWGSDTVNWHHPVVFLNFLKSISALDWLWLGLLALTGVLLLRPHKATWTVAIGTLMLVLFINLYRWGNGQFEDSGLFVHGQLFISCLVTAFALLLAFYFRFPYLDRRAQWLFTAAHRYEFRTPVSVVGRDLFEGVTESISTTGVRVHLKRDFEGSNDLRFVDIIFPEIRNIKVQSRVVEYRDNILRLEFKELSGREKTHLQEWIRSQLETGVLVEG